MTPRQPQRCCKRPSLSEGPTKQQIAAHLVLKPRHLLKQSASACRPISALPWYCLIYVCAPLPVLSTRATHRRSQSTDCSVNWLLLLAAGRRSKLLMSSQQKRSQGSGWWRTRMHIVSACACRHEHSECKQVTWCACGAHAQAQPT